MGFLPLYARRSRVLRTDGAAPAWIPILLGLAGLAAGLLATYFFSSCVLPGDTASEIGGYQYVQDVCGPEIVSISIRPQHLVIPVKPLGAANLPLEFEVEALGYRSDGGGVPPECELQLTWDATPAAKISAVESGENRGLVTIQPAALANPFPGTIRARLASHPDVSGSANVNVLGQGPSIRDSVRADADGTVTVALLDGAIGSSFTSSSVQVCRDTVPVSFVSVGVLPNLGALCPQSFERAAIFGAKRAAWFQDLTNGSWGINRTDEVDASGGIKSLEPMQVAVWIAIDDQGCGSQPPPDLGGLSLSQARNAARQDAIADAAWANLVYRNERVGLRLQADPYVVQGPDLENIRCPPSGEGGGPSDIDDYTKLDAAYDQNRVNVYYVNRAWGNGQYDATASRPPIIIISWQPSWRPDPSTLAHEVGHALGLDDLSNGVNDNLMRGLLTEWRSRLSVGQLYVMNFAESSWAVMQPGSARQPGCNTSQCPAWDVGVGQ